MRTKESIPTSMKAIFDIGGFTKEFDVAWPPPPDMQIVAPLSLNMLDFKTGQRINNAPDIKRWEFVRKHYDGKRALYVFHKQI